MIKKATLVTAFAISLQAASMLALGANDVIEKESSEQASINAYINQRRTHAVDIARAGNTDEALTILSDLHQQYPNNTKIQADYLVVLNWANQHAKAVASVKGLALESLPDYALGALLKSARNIANHTVAMQVADEQLKRMPANVDYQIARLLVLIDSKQFTQANETLDLLKEKNPNYVELLNAQIYLGQESNSPIKIIDACQHLLVINPNNQQAALTLASAASRLGATSKAAEIAKQYQFNAKDSQVINANKAATQVRWGGLDAPNPRQPYAEIDLGLKALDEACQCDWDNAFRDADKHRLIFDRMVGLRDRHELKKVIAHYQQLQSIGVTLPNFALHAAADAYLTQKMPEQALSIFNLIINNDKLDYEAKKGKFYALIELEQFDQAFAVSLQFASEQPIYLRRNKNPVVRQNDKKLDADSTAYLGLAYADKLAESDTSFGQLHAIGPNNIPLRNNQAFVWRMRDWPELAKKTYIATLKQEPSNLQTKFGLANTHLDLHDWIATKDNIAELNQYISPADPSMKALNRRWQLHNMRQLTVDFNTRNANGGTFGSRSQEIDARLYSAPFDNYYRAFVDTSAQYGTFPEGTGKVIDPAVGLEYRKRNWRLSTQIGAALADGSGVTSLTNVAYRYDDFWRFEANLDINSAQMPLRGQRVSIRGNAVNAGLTYRWNELMQASATVNLMDMSDGNLRQSINANLDRRIYTSPHYKTNVQLNANASRNTSNGAVYYNPKSDSALSVGLVQNWLTWRRYDRSFSQVLALNAGVYQQQNFGSAGTWGASYKHTWQLDQQLELNYGIGRNSQAYDGIREFSNTLFGSINLLF